MTLPLSHAERIARGIRARKQLSRSAHAAFDLAACPSDPLEVLRNADRGRLPPLLEIKHQRMAASPFGFFRGAVPLMAADLACHPNTGLITQICGDAHVLNLGAYAAVDGRLVFDINDFDETIRAPFEWDLKRLATSLILAGREAGIRRAIRREAVEIFIQQYRVRMREFAAMPVVDLARYQIHRLAHIDPLPVILRSAERSTPQRLLVKLTEPAAPPQPRSSKPAKSGAPDLRAPEAAVSSPKGLASATAEGLTQARHFRNQPPLLTRLASKDEQPVLDSLNPYARTLQPERRHFLEQYLPIDVAFKVVGTGSVGLRDYCIYAEGIGLATTDPLFLQIKEETASAYAPYLPEAAAAHTHQGHRVVDGQRALQLTSDPFLGYTTLAGRDYLVRQLNDHKAALNLATLKPASLLGYADLCGELFARGHARAGDPVSLSAYLGNSNRFDRALLTFAHTYADKTQHDWELFKKAMKQK